MWVRINNDFFFSYPVACLVLQTGTPIMIFIDLLSLADLTFRIYLPLISPDTKSVRELCPCLVCLCACVCMCVSICLS